MTRDGSVVKAGVIGSVSVLDGVVQVRERGVGPGSSIDVWLVKGKHFLGTLTADSVGVVQGRLEIPQGIEAGVNTLQLVERNCNTVGSVVSLGLNMSNITTLPGTGGNTSPFSLFAGLLAITTGVFLRRRLDA